MATGPSHRILNPENPNAPILIDSFLGIKNIAGPERLSPNDLVAGVNLDIDDFNQVRRRRGRTKKIDGVFHSLTNTLGGDVFAVKDGDLVRVKTNYTLDTVLAGVGDARIAYVELGDTLFWNSRTHGGKINLDTKLNSGWGVLNEQSYWLSPVLQPTDTLGEVAGKLLRDPPRADYMTYFNGRIYMARGNVVWATELWKYDYVDATRTYMMFEGDVTGLGTTGEGIFVGTDKGTFFCHGTFGEMRKNPVDPNPVIPGSMVDAPDVRYPDSPSRRVVTFLTTQGLIAGMDAGMTRAITADRFSFPDAELVPGAINRSQDGVSQYLATLNSGGSPAANARIGDYLDAEIRRASQGA